MFNFVEKELIIDSFFEWFSTIGLDKGCFNGVTVKFSDKYQRIKVEYSCISREKLPGGLRELTNVFYVSYECFRETWNKTSLTETVCNLVRVSKNKLIVDLDFMRESVEKGSEKK